MRAGSNKRYIIWYSRVASGKRGKRRISCFHPRELSHHQYCSSSTSVVQATVLYALELNILPPKGIWQATGASERAIHNSASGTSMAHATDPLQQPKDIVQRQRWSSSSVTAARPSWHPIKINGKVLKRQWNYIKFISWWFPLCSPERFNTFLSWQPLWNIWLCHGYGTGLLLMIFKSVKNIFISFKNYYSPIMDI